MMHAHPMPAISVGLIVRAGAAYDTHHHWRNEPGELRASVGFDVGGSSHGHIQGPPAALPELAAALVEAADLADTAASAIAEGVAG